MFRNQTIEKTIKRETVKFNINNKREFLRFSNLGGERAIIEDLLSELQSDDVVFDVGANVGTYTCFISQKAPASQIIAFEPHPTNLDGLQSNLRLNNRDAITIEKALADSVGTAELEVASPDIGEGKHSLATGKASETIEIKLTTGDRLVENGSVPQPTILKVDVEGAEGRVFAGMHSILSRSACRICYVEVHPDRLKEYSDTESDIVTTLEDCGFDVARLSYRGSEYFLKGKK
ncbi:FkbM family methyltransferase [Haloquadratum walsbyi]|uniref:FkbM family methyltransferase n=1 Tax=Haloquadratum walsbyi TaxID=293091 RepID=UPI00067775F3|nr:FkbM family methyltransferase [Haloquadratum walsbyi]